MRAQGRAPGVTSSGQREDERTSQSSDHASIDPAVRNLHALTRDELVAAIKDMARAGWSDHGIAHATRLSVEMVRQIIGDRRQP